MKHETDSFAVGSPEAPYRVVMLHGYTGSPDGFREVAERIARELDAYVTAPLLPGHGTTLDDLQNVAFEELQMVAREAVEEAAKSGKPFAIVGYCFGGYLAALVADEFPPTCLVLALTAYGPRFPFSIPGIARLFALRSSWDKYFYPDERKMREDIFHYARVPGTSQMLVNIGIERITPVLPRLSMPILTMHTTEDPTVSPKSGANLLAASGHNEANEMHLLPGRRHNLFFGPKKQEDMDILVSFLRRRLLK